MAINDPGDIRVDIQQVDNAGTHQVNDDPASTQGAKGSEDLGNATVHTNPDSHEIAADPPKNFSAVHQGEYIHISPKKEASGGRLSVKDETEEASKQSKKLSDGASQAATSKEESNQSELSDESGGGISPSSGSSATTSQVSAYGADAGANDTAAIANENSQNLSNLASDLEASNASNRGFLAAADADSNAEETNAETTNEENTISEEAVAADEEVATSDAKVADTGSASAVSFNLPNTAADAAAIATSAKLPKENGNGNGNPDTASVQAPELIANNTSGNEDSPIELNLTASLVDNSPGEKLSIIITGVPEDATLSAGKLNNDGSYTLNPADLDGLTITPGEHASENFELTITAEAKHGNDTALTTSNIEVNVNPIADAPTLTVDNVSVNEDSTIALNINSSLTDSSEDLSIVVSGVPEGATLSAGTDNNDGSWTLTPAQLSGLTITPPENSAENFDLAVTATSTDGNDTASTSETLSVNVNPIADAPTLTVSNVSGNEDSAIALNAINVALSNPAETLGNITISGVPSGATLSAGTNNNDGSWTLTPVQLVGLTITPPEHSSEDFDLTVAATSIDGDNTATTSKTLSVNVSAVADAPTISAENVSGNEDSSIALDINSALVDTDNSESLSIVISGMPDGSSLSAGTDNGDGTWTLTSDQLNGLTFNAPDEAGTHTLTATATSTESEGSSTATQSVNFNITVEEDDPNVIEGTGNADIILGTAGADQIFGGGGGDTIQGLDGNDELHGEGGNDELHGGAGNDELHGGSNSDALYGDLGDDVLHGDGGNDDLYGGAGNDELHGGSNSDELYGELGDDVLHGDGGNDDLYGGAGNDELHGGGNSDELHGDLGDDVLHGDGGNDDLYGGAGADTLYGGDGSDKLYGELGNDTLQGGKGSDELYGDAGDDLFLFGDNEGNSNTINGGSGSWIDTIQLSDATQGPTAALQGEGSWVLHVDNNADYTVDEANNIITFNTGDASGSITLNDGSHVDFSNIDRIEW